MLAFILFYGNVINLANYSVLSYTFSGAGYSNPIFELVKYSRLPMLFVGVLLFSVVMVRSVKLRSFIVKNVDIFLFLLVMISGLINSLDIINGLFYTLWQSAALITVLLFLFFLNKHSDRENSFRNFMQLLFWSNFFVLPLLVFNFHTLGSGWTYYMAFSSKTFYPYCLLTILLAMYSSRVLLNRSIFNGPKRRNLLFEWILILGCLFFCFVSARRTPLFLMVLLTPPYIYLTVGRRLWKRIALVFVLVTAIAASIPVTLKYINEHKYELAALKKLNDLSKSSGDFSKDASYNERKLVWDSYFKVYKRYPIVGVGSYNGSVVHTKMFDGERVEGYSTHNLYLGILVEHGLLGILLFATIFVRSLIILFISSKFRFFILYNIFLIAPILIINWNEYNLIPGQIFYWSTILVIIFPRIYLLYNNRYS